MFVSRKKRGGGAAIFIKDWNEYSTIKIVDQENWSHIFYYDSSKVIFSTYNPSNNQNFLLLLDEELTTFRNKKVISMGDINIKIIDDSRLVSNFKEIFVTNGFQLLNENIPSKNTQHSQTLIEHILKSSKVDPSIELSKIGNKWARTANPRKRNKYPQKVD